MDLLFWINEKKIMNKSLRFDSFAGDKSFVIR